MGLLAGWVACLRSLTSRRHGVPVLLAFLIGFHVWAPHTPLKSPVMHRVPWRLYQGVIDERGRYHTASSLLSYTVYHWQGRPYPYFPLYAWSRQGFSVRQGPVKVAVVDSVGMFGFWAGPEKTVVDVWALTDPFLARLPDADGRIWRPGHFERNLPQGYLETLLTGENRLRDPRLRALWDRVALVTQGPLWSPARCRAQEESEASMMSLKNACPSPRVFHCSTRRAKP